MPSRAIILAAETTHTSTSRRVTRTGVEVLRAPTDAGQRRFIRLRNDWRSAYNIWISYEARPLVGAGLLLRPGEADTVTGPVRNLGAIYAVSDAPSGEAAYLIVQTDQEDYLDIVPDATFRAALSAQHAVTTLSGLRAKSRLELLFSQSLTDVTGLDQALAADQIYIYNNSIVGRLPSLRALTLCQRLYCYQNDIYPEIDVTGMSALAILICQQNARLTRLRGLDTTALTTLRASTCDLRALDMAILPTTTVEIDVSVNTNLVLAGDVARFPGLVKIDVRNSPMTRTIGSVEGLVSLATLNVQNSGMRPKELGLLVDELHDMLTDLDLHTTTLTLSNTPGIAALKGTGSAGSWTGGTHSTKLNALHNAANITVTA